MRMTRKLETIRYIHHYTTSKLSLVGGNLYTWKNFENTEINH